VREHARRHYETGGWDFVVECYEDRDILAAMGGATTPGRAIRNVAKVVAMQDDRRRDIEATAF
jgi:hypothetical protein